MDVRRDFAARPPREELNSLAAFVRDFQWRFPRARRDMVVEYCREAYNFETAVARAVGSRAANGKMHNHQSRVKESARVEFGMSIRSMREKEWREEIGARPMNTLKPFPDQVSPRAFDRLHDRFDELKPVGIGPVTVYDVAVRVGAYLDLEPQSLYLHAGVRQGWISMKLALEGVGWPIDSGRPSLAKVRQEAHVPYLPREAWPAPLRRLTADEAEDFCCTYREEFRRYRAKTGRLEAGE